MYNTVEICFFCTPNPRKKVNKMLSFPRILEGELGPDIKEIAESMGLSEITIYATRAQSWTGLVILGYPPLSKKYQDDFTFWQLQATAYLLPRINQVCDTLGMTVELQR